MSSTTTTQTVVVTTEETSTYILRQLLPLRRDRNEEEINEDEDQNHQENNKKIICCSICYEPAKRMSMSMISSTSSDNDENHQNSPSRPTIIYEGLFCNSSSSNKNKNNNHRSQQKGSHYFCSSCLSNDIILRWAKIEHEPDKIPEFYCPVPGCHQQQEEESNDDDDDDDDDTKSEVTIKTTPSKKKQSKNKEQEESTNKKDEKEQDIPLLTDHQEINNYNSTKDEEEENNKKNNLLSSLFFSLQSSSSSSSKIQNNNNNHPKQAFTTSQIAKHCSDSALQHYLQVRQNFRDAIILGAANELAQKAIRENRKDADKMILAQQFQLQFGDKAIMCPKCKLMTTWTECSDLKRHNNQLFRGRGVDPGTKVTAQTDNACKHCRFFTKHRSKWLPFDGILRDEDELLAEKDSWKDVQVDSDDEEDEDDGENENNENGGERNNNTNRNNNNNNNQNLSEEAKVQMFRDVCGTDEATALQFVQDAGGELQRAINTFFGN